MADLTHPSHQVALQALYDILDDFHIPRPSPTNGPQVVFNGAIPPPEQTKSQKFSMSLIGAIPSLANAVTAAQIFEARTGARQTVEVDLCRSHNYTDPDFGMTPTFNGQEVTLDVLAGNPFLGGIFETKDGRWVVLSAVYVDLAYQWSALLDCPLTDRRVREVVKLWNAEDLEATAAKAGMPMSICHTEESWLATFQGSHMAKLPIVPVEKVVHEEPNGLNFPTTYLPPSPNRPLSGLKVIAMTHAVAGPATGRTLAEHGASVLQIMFTHGHEHPFVFSYAFLGAASTRLNLHKEADRDRLWTLIREAHVWIDNFRQGAISKFGFTDEAMWKANPELIIDHVRCYGTSGPWAEKPGFDMQGSASSGMMYLAGEGIGDGRPQWPPGMMMNDYVTGYYSALAILGIILRRCRDGSDTREGWRVSPSLCSTGMSIMKYFKTRDRFSATKPDAEATVEPAATALPPKSIEGPTPMGYLKTVAPLPKMSLTPIRYEDGLLSGLGADRPVFPGHDDGYDTTKLTPMKRAEWYQTHALKAISRLERLSQMGQEERNKYHGTSESGMEEVISNGISKTANVSFKELQSTSVASATMRTV